MLFADRAVTAAPSGHDEDVVLPPVASRYQVAASKPTTAPPGGRKRSSLAGRPPVASTPPHPTAPAAARGSSPSPSPAPALTPRLLFGHQPSRTGGARSSVVELQVDVNSSSLRGDPRALRVHALQWIAQGKLTDGFRELHLSLELRRREKETKKEKEGELLWPYAEEFILIANGEAVRRAYSVEVRAAVSPLYEVALAVGLMAADPTAAPANPLQPQPVDALRYFSGATARLPGVLRALVLNNKAAFLRLCLPGDPTTALRLLMEGLLACEGVLCLDLLYNMATVLLAMGRFDDAMEAVARCIEVAQLYVGIRRDGPQPAVRAAFVELAALVLVDSHHLVATLSSWCGGMEETERYHCQLAAGCASTYLPEGHPLQQRCFQRLNTIRSRPPLVQSDVRELVPPQLALRMQGTIYASYSTYSITVSSLLAIAEAVPVPQELRTYMTAIVRYLARQAPRPRSPPALEESAASGALAPHPPSTRSASIVRKADRVVSRVPRAAYDHYRALKHEAAAAAHDGPHGAAMAELDRRLRLLSKLVPLGTVPPSPDRAAAATALQRCWRARLARRERAARARALQAHLQALTEEAAAPPAPDPAAAATKVQRWWRGRDARRARRHYQRWTAALRIQTIWWHYKTRCEVRAMQQQQQQQPAPLPAAAPDSNKEAAAATKIQATWRMFLVRRRCAKLLQYLLYDVPVAAIRIQRQWRRYAAQRHATNVWMDRQHYDRYVQQQQADTLAVRRIQSVVRRFLARRRRAALQRARDAAVTANSSPQPASPTTPARALAPAAAPSLPPPTPAPFVVSVTTTRHVPPPPSPAPQAPERRPPLSGDSAATQIQKVWRGYSVRRKYTYFYEFYEVEEDEEEDGENSSDEM